MSDVFISYASQDRQSAERLAGELAAEGWSVWWDRAIPPGRTFAEVIEEALNASKCVVVLWSKASIGSRWVHKEARFGDKNRTLLPALIEEVLPPFEFADVQAASLIAWRGETTHPGYRQLADAITGLAGAPSKPAEEAMRQAEAEADAKGEAEAKRKAEEEEARRKADEEAARKKTEAQAEAKRKAEEEARRKAEQDEARRKADEQVEIKRAEEETEAKRRAEKEEQAKREVEKEAQRREVEMQARQKAEHERAEANRKAEVEAGRTAEKPVVPKPPDTSPSKAPWIVVGAVVVVLGIVLAVVQPWRSSNPPTRPAEQSESKPETKPDVAAGASKTLEAVETFRDCDVCPEMVVVPAGSFLMGSPDTEADAYTEKPQHRVTIAKPFAVGVYEVTNAEFVAFLNAVGKRDRANEPWFKTKSQDDSSRIVYSGGNHYGVEQGFENHPVVNVSWYGAWAYTDWLSKKTDEDYRLLTEAEWEYVARAGTEERYSVGDTITEKDANFGSNVGNTTKVGSYDANPWGLRDVHGNVWEWVADCYDVDAYKNHKNYPTIVGGWQDPCIRVLRGGSWKYPPRFLRSAHRYYNYADDRGDLSGSGFRVARTL